MCWSLGFPGVSLGYLGVWRGIREVSPEVWFEVYTTYIRRLPPHVLCGVRAASSPKEIRA